MAAKDKLEKLLEDFNDVFADIYNTLVFKSKLLKKTYLYPSATESVYKSATGDYNGQYRDILKLYMDNHLQLLSVGIENQSTPDKHMPIRVMGYDYATYREMISNGMALRPVITAVLNFTNTPWRTARSIHELLSLPDEFKSYVSDYRIQVYDIAYLDDEIIESFTSDFKLIARFFKQKRLGIPPEHFFNSQDTISHAEAFFDFLSVFTGDPRYKKLPQVTANSSKKGRKPKLCNYYDSIEQMGIAKGIERGKFLVLQKFVSEGTISLAKACAELELSEEEFLSLESVEEN